MATDIKQVEKELAELEARSEEIRKLIWEKRVVLDFLEWAAEQ